MSPSGYCHVGVEQDPSIPHGDAGLVEEVPHAAPDGPLLFNGQSSSPVRKVMHHGKACARVRIGQLGREDQVPKGRPPLQGCLAQQGAFYQHHAVVDSPPIVLP